MKKLKQPLSKFLIVFGFITLISACSNSEMTTVDVKPKSVTPVETNSSNTESVANHSPYSKFTSLIGLSCESDRECKVAGVGHSPCGGHAHYLVYSETDSNSKMLLSNIKRYNDMQKKKNAKEKKMGICRHIPAPKTFCSANRCVTTKTETH